MKFLDKIKDLFVDEEEVIEEEVINVEEDSSKEHQLPTFMRKKIEEEQEREEKQLLANNRDLYQREFKKENESGTENTIKEEVRSRNNNFSFPIDMDDDYDNNYVNNDYGRSQNVLEREKTVEQLYSKKEEPKPKKFKASPVISPVYGVLDKNYTKDEVKVQDEKDYAIPRTKKVDFETVRNKAFGSLTDDIRNALCENCELYKEVKIIKKKAADELKKEDNLLNDMTEDDITLADAEDNYYDFGVDYEVPKIVEKAPEEEDIKIVNHNEEESTAEKIEVKEEPNELKDKIVEKEEIINEEAKNESINEENDETITGEVKGISNEEDSDENDIFKLIDSMYEGDE